MKRAQLIEVARRLPILSRLTARLDALHAEKRQLEADNQRLRARWDSPGEVVPTEFEEQVYSAIVAKSDVVLDVGANVGNVASYVARLAGPDGMVIAFEPVWPTFIEMCANLQSGWRPDRAPIVPVNLGASDEDRTTLIHVADGKFGEASVGDVANHDKGANIVSYEAKFVRLDSFVETQRLPRPAVVKIDVEGAEKFVVDGIMNWVRNEGQRPILLIEMIAKFEKELFGYSPWDVLSPLKANGYVLYFQCPEGLVPYQPTKEKPFPPEFERGYNVIAVVPQEHKAANWNLTKLIAGQGGKILPMYPAVVPNIA